MKHHDSIAQADKKMRQAAKQLQHWSIPATPINYAIAYEFISGKNQELSVAIKQQLSFNKPLDDFFLDDIYKQYVLGQSKFRDGIINDIDNLLDTIKEGSENSTKSIDSFISQLDNNLTGLQSSDKVTAATALKNLFKESQSFKFKQQKLTEQLLASQRQSMLLKSELDDVRKEIFLDPLTNLFNRKALNKHIEEWLTNDPNKNIAAIVVNIDDFANIKEKFGPLISDVLLSKIANKVGSYVGESGFPFRSAGNEFLILLPEIPRSIAGDIADKIRQGVEKMRFISSKSGVRLPKLTISLGVNDFRVSENINNVVHQTRTYMTAVANGAKNTVSVVSSEQDANDQFSAPLTPARS